MKNTNSLSTRTNAHTHTPKMPTFGDCLLPVGPVCLFAMETDAPQDSQLSMLQGVCSAAPLGLCEENPLCTLVDGDEGQKCMLMLPEKEEMCAEFDVDVDPNGSCMWQATAATPEATPPTEPDNSAVVTDPAAAATVEVAVAIATDAAQAASDAAKAASDAATVAASVTAVASEVTGSATTTTPPASESL